MKAYGTEVREILLLMPPERAAILAERVQILMERYGTKTMVETIERVVSEALDG